MRDQTTQADRARGAGVRPCLRDPLGADARAPDPGSIGLSSPWRGCTRRAPRAVVAMGPAGRSLSLSAGPSRSCSACGRPIAAHNASGVCRGCQSGPGRYRLLRAASDRARLVLPRNPYGSAYVAALIAILDACTPRALNSQGPRLAVGPEGVASACRDSPAGSIAERSKLRPIDDCGPGLCACGHRRGWHRFGGGACLECDCLEWTERALYERSLGGVS